MPKVELMTLQVTKHHTAADCHNQTFGNQEALRRKYSSELSPQNTMLEWFLWLLLSKGGGETTKKFNNPVAWRQPIASMQAKKAKLQIQLP